MSEIVKRYNLVIIGDTHFGVRNNSMTWLKHQKEGFKEIIDYVEKSMCSHDWTHVVHVGDLFDSRSSINPLIWREVVKLLSDMDAVLNSQPDNDEGGGHMTIIGGNHDYYYPWESEHNFTGIQMLPKFENIGRVVNSWGRCDNVIMIPWFVFHNKKLLKEAVDLMQDDDIIITHTDPYHMDPEIRKLVGKHPLITGHIHQPNMDWEMFWLVTGATYPIDFTDTNSKRGFWTIEYEYVWDDEDESIPKETRNMKVDFHPVESSIHFHSLTEDILEKWKNYGIKEDDYVEIIIKQSHVEDHKETIKELNDRFTTSMTYLPEESGVLMEASDILTADAVCRKLLPPKLKGCYNQMVTACEKKE